MTESLEPFSNKLKKYQKISSPNALVEFIRTAENENLNVVKLERNEIFNLDVFTEKHLREKSSFDKDGT